MWTLEISWARKKVSRSIYVSQKREPHLFLGLYLIEVHMYDALCLIFMILVSLENVKKYSHVVARLPQRLKSTLFEIFSTLRVPFGHPPFEKISNNVDFSLWGKQCICPAKMRPKLWKSHIVLQKHTRVYHTCAKQSANQRKNAQNILFTQSFSGNFCK